MRLFQEEEVRWTNNFKAMLSFVLLFSGFASA